MKFMSWYHPSSLLDKVFEASLLIKGLTGLLEFLGGLMLVFVSPDKIHNFLMFITQKELNTEPNSTIALLVLHSANHLNTGSRDFLIFYLWIHAAIKLTAVIGILKNQLWAYPFSLICLGILMIYQLYSIATKPTLGMIALTAFDVFIVWLIWREYQKAKILLKPTIEQQ